MAHVIKEITVNDLFNLCLSERMNGNGKKKVLISDDDEGNGYHHLFYGFSPTTAKGDPLNFFEAACTNYPLGVNAKNVKEYIILG